MLSRPLSKAIYFCQNSALLCHELLELSDLAMARQRPPSEEKPWSTMDLVDLRHAIEQGESVELTAAVLGRSVEDVQRKAKELYPIKNSDR